MAHNDRHVLGVGGYVGEIPAAEHTSLPVIWMDGTGDDSFGAACAVSRPLADAYARQYNSTILAAVGR